MWDLGSWLNWVLSLIFSLRSSSSLKKRAYLSPLVALALMLKCFKASPTTAIDKKGRQLPSLGGLLGGK
ncbi:hypothetical protein COX24_00620 [bacterium (Candidatus Gribaldobacteria) CG23_combo_of_CG06-09_8_20_14_all_37_87_8]|uniref:Uncharacterized protein n=2 Tax=Candidatus Gribaldobacteria TaxID=2798536 RepID=A0A2G9ZFN5_9BACT|nr:MAG: hypothetical protein AUJ25_01355 [Parcubacteria group bacterium CG1_02_37_13]PIP31982.1 MAG: hypothetical protein COX24_00620 [bacterium (Candidatus Gribaldobacteria) CG23_combo_of_CG06-09_8_20_14_all_37_87_8]PIR90754.1 MAG: hypothetical protein COU05_00365 [bacterium (Candidatus Gribaldobacteria) CG10_big_fil_rev_8_21_14_0_10_37_21]